MFQFRKGASPLMSKSSITTRGEAMTPPYIRVLRRELQARGLSANRVSLDLGVPSG
jgi:hypothetical protein